MKDEKYKVTQEFMEELKQWRDDYDLDAKKGGIFAFADGHSIKNIPIVVEIWWAGLDDPIENNNRLITIIQWLNGEDVFEVEQPRNFVVRSENTDTSGEYVYLTLFKGLVLPTDYQNATKFDTREEAQEWANSHQVVVGIDEEGNEAE